MNFRTDLAIELAQQLQDTVSQDYQTVQKEEDGAVVFHTKILEFPSIIRTSKLKEERSCCSKQGSDE